MKLIIQPDHGLAPTLKAIKKATKSIDIVIFRFDRVEVEQALEAAVERGVPVRALIAHTNKGGEKNLRKLEARLLQSGVTVARTADDLPRYHGKMMIVDGSVLHVYGFNLTRLDIEKSRSFGVVTRNARLVQEALRLFDADMTRQPYDPAYPRLVVSPENSREVLTAFIRGAQKQLLIYDAQVSDNLIQRVLAQRSRAGVEIRIIGKLEKALDGVRVCKLDRRLHVRAIIRDGKTAFVGSQSLRRPELDGRREVGVVTSDASVAKKMAAVFETDWARIGGNKVKPKDKIRVVKLKAS